MYGWCNINIMINSFLFKWRRKNKDINQALENEAVIKKQLDKLDELTKTSFWKDHSYQLDDQNIAKWLHQEGNKIYFIDNNYPSAIIGQKTLTTKMLEFCNVARDDKNKKLLNYLGPRQLWKFELKRIRKKISGLCLGLSNIFLFAAFISDMKDVDKEYISLEQKKELDDLAWFNRCIFFLLVIPPNRLTQEQKYEISRFISLVLHFQNNTKIYKSNNVYDDSNSKTSRNGNLQRSHVKNAEFTGKYGLEFEEAQVEDSLDTTCPKSKIILERPGPLYINFSIMGGSLRNRHAVSLYKTKDNRYIYYDPNKGFQNVRLNSIVDLNKFKQHILISGGALVDVIIHIGVPVEKTPKDKISLS